MRKAVTAFPAEVSAVRYVSSEGVKFLVVVLDVTEKFELIKLRRSFVSMVSHELRTPLTSIQSFLGMLNMGVYGELPDQVLKLGASAERSTNQLIRLINELLDVEKLEITIGLNDTQIVSVEKGRPVNLRVEALAGEPFVGEVDAVGGALDQGTRKFPVRIEVDNTQGRLLPGMVAVIDLELGAPREEILLPLEAIVDEFGLKYAYVIQPDGPDQWVAEKRRIEVRSLPFLPTQVAVKAGVTEGELVALSSVRQLRDGLAVRPIAESAPQARNRSRGAE